MKLIFLIICGIFCVSFLGCSSIDLGGKLDGYISEQIKNDVLSIDCKAGLANGSIIAGSSNSNVKALAFTLEGMANQASEDYRKCFAFAAWKSFEYRKGLNDVENVIGKLVNMGVIK